MAFISFMNFASALWAVVCMIVGAWVAGRWMTRKVIARFGRDSVVSAGQEAPAPEIHNSTGLDRICLNFTNGTACLQVAPEGIALNLISYGKYHFITLSNGEMIYATDKQVIKSECISKRSMD